MTAGLQFSLVIVREFSLVIVREYPPRITWLEALHHLQACEDNPIPSKVST